MFKEECLQNYREQKGSTEETKIISIYFEDIKLQNPVTLCVPLFTVDVQRQLIILLLSYLYCHYM
jgi:hypothetical protein